MNNQFKDMTREQVEAELQHQVNLVSALSVEIGNTVASVVSAQLVNKQHEETIKQKDAEIQKLTADMMGYMEGKKK